MRVPHAVGKCVLLFLIQLALNGCIQSDKNLLSDTVTGTPLPDIFSLVVIDKNGEIELDNKTGNTLTYNFVLNDGVYKQENTDKDGIMIFSLYNIGIDDTYMLRYMVMVKDKKT